jgi:hypothetical protein
VIKLKFTIYIAKFVFWLFNEKKLSKPLIEIMKHFLLFFLLISSSILMAQKESSYLSGNFQNNTNFFLRDSLVGTPSTPQYDYQFIGSETWLNLYYNRAGFDIGVRFDLYKNSNLPNPANSRSFVGLGNAYIRKRFKKMDITVGHIYDQIGTGTIFRAFEERPLAIDNSLLGARVIYDLSDDWRIKVFSGQQKNALDNDLERYPTTYKSAINGASIDGYWSPSDTSDLSFAPGVGIVNRTLDEQTIQQIRANMVTGLPDDRFTPNYNTYAFSLFNTLQYKNFSWYFEGSYKTAEAISDPISSVGYVNKPGSVLYSSFGYSTKGFGLTVQGKRTDYFDFRVTPNETLNRGLITFIPPMTRTNTYRLTARYNAATQFLGEQAAMFDISYAPTRKQSYLLTLSNITDLSGDLLYREAYLEATFKGKRSKWQSTSGLQLQQYNQELYEIKPNAPLVETIVPFTEFIYRINRKHSFRIEAQYMDTDEDLGSWGFALFEYNISPSWSFSVSDMVNTAPTKTDDIVHYPTFFVAYNTGPHRFTGAYVKQVQGVVCTGGVCRFEPAFSGFRLTATSSF